MGDAAKTHCYLCYTQMVEAALANEFEREVSKLGCSRYDFRDVVQ